MNTGEERKHPFFDPDEYTLINKRYFAELRENGSIELDPSGWIETITEAKIALPPECKLARGRYYMDEGNALGPLRGPLHHFLETWEGKAFESQSFTVCPSVGIASFLTMAVLSRRGVRRIVFETPCYFAAILQAEWLGFDVVLMPTYHGDQYRWPSDFEKLSNNKPTAWWTTQPRATLGFNQDIEFLRSLSERLERKDYLVIDEAIDQSFPSWLSPLFDLESRIIRLKGFGKPMGLNGYPRAGVGSVADSGRNFNRYPHLCLHSV